MPIKSSNIVYETLKAKLQDLDSLEQRIDDNYSREKKAIAEQKRQLNKALELINENASTLTNNPVAKRGRKGESFDPLNYQYDGSFKNKVLYVIHSQGRFVHVREIAKGLIAKEPIFEENKELNDLIGRSLWKIKKSGDVVDYQEGSSLRNIFYGFKEWLDTNGKIRKGFEFSADALIDKNMLNGDKRYFYNGTMFIGEEALKLAGLDTKGVK